MASYRGPVADWTFIAGADLSSYRYCVVKMTTTDNEVDVATGTDQGIVGVLQNAPASGEQALVRIFGGTKLKVDGTTDIAAGDFLTATTGGVAIKTTTDHQIYVGRAMHVTTHDGAIVVEAFVNPGNVSHT